MGLEGEFDRISQEKKAYEVQKSEKEKQKFEREQKIQKLNEKQMN